MLFDHDQPHLMCRRNRGRRCLSRRDSRRRAFTIVEMLIVLAIMALFSTLAILYSSVSRNEVALTVEESEISQFILDAKQLALATYTSTGSTSCGYGMTFDLTSSPQTYSIFAYNPAGSPPCPSVNSITDIDPVPGPSHEMREYTDGTWQVPLSQGVQLESKPDSLVTILFYPPDPTVFLSSDGATFPLGVGSLNVYLETIDGQNSATITVNSEGQITF